MPVQAVQYGSLSGVRNLPQSRPVSEVARIFNTNYAKGEIVPKVQNEVLANKLEVFA